MKYAKSFFDLQLQFARRVADFSGIPFEQALMDYTNLYIRFGLGRSFDPLRPEWQTYLAGLKNAADQNQWTFNFYLNQPGDVKPPGVAVSFGCFSYALQGNDTIRIHFENTEPKDRSPLSTACSPKRKAELRQLFEYIKNNHSDVQKVTGVSWLYNLPAYRSLFPPAYIATAKIAAPRFRNMPLWGQFIDRHGEIRPNMTAAFLENLNRQTGMEDLELCFPLQPLELEVAIDVFYEYYLIHE